MSKIGCIQINIGNEIFKFEGVDSSSTTLETLIDRLIQQDKFKDKINQLIVVSEGDINQILNSDYVDTNTTIGDTAIGNVSSYGLGVLATINSLTEAQPLKSLYSLINGFDFNILMSSTVESPRVYIGKGRDFLILHPDSLNQQGVVSQALSFLYASREVVKPNSQLHRKVLEYVNEFRNLEGSEIGESLSKLNDINAAKMLLLYSQTKQHPKLTEMLNEVGKIIYSKAKPKEINRKSILQTGNNALNKYFNATTVLNENTYRNSTLTSLIREIKFYKSKTQVNSEELLSELSLSDKNIPPAMLKYYEDYKDDTSEKGRFIKDVLLNPDPEFLNTIFEGDVYENLVNSLFQPQGEIELEESSPYYIPKLQDIRIDEDYTLDERKLIIEDNNYGLNNSIAKSDKSAEIKLSNEGDSFVTIKSGVGKSKPIILINPNHTVTDADIEKVKNAVTFKSGKNAGKSSRPFFYVLKQDIKYGGNALNKLAELFSKLNYDSPLIGSISSTGYDRFSLDVAKAAVQSNIKSTIYPNFYGWASEDIKKSDKAAFIEMLNTEMGIDFNEERVPYTFKDVQQYANFKTGTVTGLFGNDTLRRKKIGDVITISNPKTGGSAKVIVDDIISLSFTRRLSGITDLFDSYTGEYKLGTVFRYKLDDTVEERFLTRIEGNNYYLTNRTNTIKVNRSELTVTGQNPPLYLSDSRVIDGENYYYNNIGLFREDTRISKNVEPFRKFFNEELQDIATKTGYSLDEVLARFSSKSAFDNTKIYTFKRYVPDQYNYVKPSLDNYSNLSMLEIIGNQITKLGIPVRLLTSEEIGSLSAGLKEYKAFIYGGEIILNKDKATEDSPVHEMMHLVLAQLKVERYSDYKNLLEAAKELSSFGEYRSTYPELSPNDYAEEALVHIFTDYLMNRIRDYGNLETYAKNMNFKELLDKLLNLEVPIRDNAPDADILQTTLSTILLNNGSELLTNLGLGMHKTETLRTRQISNIKSNLIQNGNLIIDCK